MKIARLSCSILRTASRFCRRNPIATSFYSTTTTTQELRKPGENGNPKSVGKPRVKSVNELYRRISPVGDPNVSIVPILDRWIEEGRSVNRDQLLIFIRELRYYNRYTHALEVSMWMTDKRYFQLKISDAAIRLDLISRVHGIEEAENFFNNLPHQLRCLETYNALLNSYANAKSVEKAEAVMQKMRDLGFARTSLTYNVMLSLYCQTGNPEKFDCLIQEMDDNGIDHDRFTYGIRLNAFPSVSDIEGIAKTLARMESDPKVVLDWVTYSNAAVSYMKAGLPDKSLALLKKAEGLIMSKKRNKAYEFLLSQYAAIGEKNETLRLWELYKKNEKVYNHGYFSIISSLLKFDDFESVGEVFEEWESLNLSYDIRIPNILVGAYSRKGLVEKAEALVNRVISKGGEPNTFTWKYLATGYIQNGQTPKAVEMMKRAIMVCVPRRKPIEILNAFMKYMKSTGDVEKADEFMKALEAEGMISVDCSGQLNYIEDWRSNPHELKQLDGDS